MKISLIAAIGKNNELGRDNELLWHMPVDMKYFRDTTRGHTVIMGRKTFESLKVPLPNRRNIVITRDRNYKKDGIEIVYSLDEALHCARQDLTQEGKSEVFIIGGAEIYKQSISIADKLYITKIDVQEKTADTFFPTIGPEWIETSRDEHEADENNPHKYTFLTFKKK